MANEWASVFNLVNYNLGAALYTFPEKFAEHGILACMLALLVLAFVTLFIYHQLIACAEQTHLYGFGDLVAHGLGSLAGIIFCILVVVNSSGIFGAYAKLIQDMMTILLPTSLNNNIVFYLALLVALYMARADHAVKIPYADHLANSANVLLIVGLVGIQWFAPPFEFSETHDINIISSPSSSSTSSLWSSFLATRDVCCVFLVSFSSAQFILTFHTVNLVGRRLFWMGTKAIAISYLIYSFVGLTGASSSLIISNSQSSPSQNESGEQSFYFKMTLLHQLAASSLFGKIIVFANMVSIYLSLPLFLINLRTYCLYLRRIAFRNPNAPVHKLDHLIMIVLFAVSLCIAYAIPTLDQLIAIVSGCTDCLFMLVFPTLLSLSLRPNQHVASKLFSQALFVIGILLFLSTVLTWSVWSWYILAILIAGIVYQTQQQRAIVHPHNN